jgi:hypothetical protein
MAIRDALVDRHTGGGCFEATVLDRLGHEGADFAKRSLAPAALDVSFMGLLRGRKG